MDFLTEFVPYVALAVVRWEIREAQKGDNK